MSATVEKGVMWVTQLLLKLLTWMCNIMIGMCILVLPFTALAMIPRFVEDLPPELVAPTPLMVAAVIAFVALIIGLFVLLRMFIVNLRAIVDTVDEGDPFVIENAHRLRRMGWVSIIAYPVTILLAGVGWGLEAMHDNNAEFDFEAAVDGTGLLTILLVFILARVFEQGVAMREELEGTV